MRLSNRELYIVYFIGFLLGCGVLALLMSRRERSPQAELSEEAKDIAKMVQFLDLRREPLQPDEVKSWAELPADASGLPRIQAVAQSQLHGSALLVEQWIDENAQGPWVRKTRVWRADQLWLRLPEDTNLRAQAKLLENDVEARAAYELMRIEPLEGFEARWVLATLEATGPEALATAAQRLVSPTGPFEAALRVPVDGKDGNLATLFGIAGAAGRQGWRWYVQP
ncbi:MAG: hypothetical protein ACFB20_11215 [Opitutales bacterium]